jgi:hypothetical protein
VLEGGLQPPCRYHFVLVASTIGCAQSLRIECSGLVVRLLRVSFFSSACLHGIWHDLVVDGKLVDVGFLGIRNVRVVP